jgi:hypothetical protein
MPSSNEQAGYTLRHPLVPLKLATEFLCLVAELTTRLEQGELAGSGPIELSDGWWLPSGELAARVALADVESCIAAATRSGRQVSAARWEALFQELQHLKAMLDSHQ